MDQPEIKVRRFSRDKRIHAEEKNEQNEQPTPPPTPEPSLQVETGSDDDVPVFDDDFLEDLKDGRIPEEFLSPPPDESAPKKKRGGGGRKKKALPVEFANEFGDLFAPEATPILGKDRRELLSRISEYRALFPDELKSFKIKNGANDQQLQEALDEMEVIVSCGGVNKMLDEALLMAIQTVEVASSRTDRLDITGTADALRANAEFHKLCKLCWIKYRVFSNCPPEAQLMLVVASTAMVMRQQNMKRKEISGMLNMPL